MARETSNRIVQQNIPGGAHKDTPFNGPAVESANARVDLIGPFRRANLAIDLAAVQMTIGGVDSDAGNGVVAHSPGKIIGITYKFSANITAGGATAAQIGASVAPAATLTAAAQGTLFPVASGGTLAQTGTGDEATAVPFSKGDVLGMQITTSHTFAPTTADLDSYLVVQYAASPAG